jgi:hypothetical protein
LKASLFLYDALHPNGLLLLKTLLCKCILIACIESEYDIYDNLNAPTANLPSFKISSAKPLPKDYVLPDIANLAPESHRDDRVQFMAQRMQERADSFKGELEAIIAPVSSVAIPPTQASSSSTSTNNSSASSEIYGGPKGDAYFAKFSWHVIRPELINYFLEIRDAPINVQSFECFLRFLGKLQHYIAVKTNSQNSKDFGFFVPDLPVDPQAKNFLVDPIHFSPKWYKYFTREVLGDEFAYPFNFPPKEFDTNISLCFNPYCIRVTCRADEIKQRFRKKYENFSLVAGPSTVVACNVQGSQSITHYAAGFAFLPNFAIFHIPYSSSHLEALLSLFLKACLEPTLKNVSEVHYFIIIRSFYVRGQGAISLWIINALCATIGKILVIDDELRKTCVNLDQFALMHLSFTDYLAFIEKHVKLVDLN